MVNSQRGRAEGHVSIRLPPDLHERLKKSAKDKDRTLSAEIIALLRRSIEQEPPLETPDYEPAQVAASQNASNSVARALENRLEFVEKAISALCRNEKLIHSVPEKYRAELRQALFAIRE